VRTTQQHCLHFVRSFTCGLPLPHRDVLLGQLEAEEHRVKLGGKPRMLTPRGCRAKVARVDWLRKEVAAMEHKVLEARERALVYNATPSYFVLFRSVPLGTGDWTHSWWAHDILHAGKRGQHVTLKGQCLCCVAALEGGKLVLSRGAGPRRPPPSPPRPTSTPCAASSSR
jgi:hypothetical protein